MRYDTLADRLAIERQTVHALGKSKLGKDTLRSRRTNEWIVNTNRKKRNDEDLPEEVTATIYLSRFATHIDAALEGKVNQVTLGDILDQLHTSSATTGVSSFFIFKEAMRLIGFRQPAAAAKDFIKTYIELSSYGLLEVDSLRRSRRIQATVQAGRTLHTRAGAAGPTHASNPLGLRGRGALY